MLGYQWNTHTSAPQLIITDDDMNHDPSNTSSSNPHRQMFDDTFSSPCSFPHHNPSPALYQDMTTQQQSYPYLQHSQNPYQDPYNLALPEPQGSGYPILVPKPEQPDYTNIGLNLGLGGRTYFASDDDLVSRLYRRSRPGEPVNQPKCQAEGCNADLTHAKHYHRRHKVCEFHSKASTVIVNGVTQRFCQQCSRFHLLSEFDNGKRSCRKRLADHNRRRRKSNQTTSQDHMSSSQSENAHAPCSPSPSTQRSPSDSGANSMSSVTIAISPPRASFESNFRQRFYE